jgi:Xaa-Pro dipeptidase
MINNRITLLKDLMQAEKLDILAINAGVDLEYFTGLKFHLSERPAVLLIPTEGLPVFIFPDFEKEKTKQSAINLDLFSYPEDTNEWPKIFSQASTKLGLSNKIIGVSPESMRFLELDLIQKAAGHHNFVSAMEIMKKLKIQKDPEEITSIKKAISIAENALIMLKPKIQAGISEKFLANQLVIYLLTEGSEPDLPFDPIVASGPNSSNPHARPGDRLLQEGDAVTIDWGARVDGYVSDLTRSFLIGNENSLMKKIASVVLEANQAAREIARPGIAANELDKAARAVITRSGYGDYFTHRTGHGIGLLAHEDPYISQNNLDVLKKGMIFTIEPGIYLPGQGGIRIEDDLLVGEKDCKTLTNLKREVTII